MNDITENNRLISDFVGLNPIATPNFHREWSHLKPVIDRLYDAIPEDDQTFSGLLVFELGLGVDIDTAYKAVLQAINHYNEKIKPQQKDLSTLDVLKREVDNFIFMEPDWDSYGEDVPTQRTIDNAKIVLDRIALYDDLNDTYVFPGRDGSIQIDIGAYKKYIIVEEKYWETIINSSTKAIKETEFIFQ